MADTDKDRMRGTTDPDRGLAQRVKVKVKTVKGETIEVTQEELDAAPKYRKWGPKQIVGKLWDQITPDKDDDTDGGTGTRNTGGTAQGVRG